MYKHLLKPIFFRFSAESCHHFIINLLKIMSYTPFAKPIVRSLFRYKHPSLEREVFGLKFPNPVGLAAGFDKNAEVYDSLGCLGFGFVEIGTVTPKAQSGNPKPRLFRLVKDEAFVNRMGFNNLGVENAVNNLRHRNKKLIIGGNIGKNTTTSNEDAPADYLRLFRSMYDYVDYFVVNVSCPNVANLRQLQSKDNTVNILQLLRDFRKGQSDYRPILLKISPDLDEAQIEVMIEVVKECKIDGIVATNTTTSREGLQTSPRDIKNIGNGGLSGATLTKRAIEVVRYVHEKTDGKLPIIGVGGIMTPQDAQAMLDAGASLVQIYSGFVYNGPGLAKKICKHIAQNKK